MPIPVPDSVKVTVTGDLVSIKGPKGSLSHTLPAGISCEVDGKELLLAGPGVMKLIAERQVEAFATAGITSGFLHGGRLPH